MALRQGLSGGMAKLAMCFEDAPRATYRVRRHVTLRVVFAMDGQIEALHIHGAGTGDPGLGQCLREQLDPLRSLTERKQSITLSLKVAMQFWFGTGSPFSDHRAQYLGFEELPGLWQILPGVGLEALEARGEVLDVVSI